MKLSLSIPAMLALAAVGCAGPDGDPPRPVTAAGETVVTTDPEVDADDPAIWADPADPSRAVIFATDKTDGLYVHNLDGTVRQFFPDGPLNNVDLRPGFAAEGREWVLVAATERNRFGIVVYLFDPETLETRNWGFVPTDIGEPYGVCMGVRGGAYYALVNSTEGVIQQIRIEAGPAGPIATIERSLKLPTQTEGCVVDDEADRFYIGEEAVALWRYSFDPADYGEPARIAAADGRIFTADIEGLTIMRDAGAKYLIGSSQGDSTFPTYRIDGDTLEYLGRFAVADSATVDGVSGTDGLDAWSGPIGNFPEGLLVIHDAEDDSGPNQQNYKLVDWRAVKAALGID